MSGKTYGCESFLENFPNYGMGCAICRVKLNKTKKIRKHFLSGDEILTTREYWIRREQQEVVEDLQASAWKLNRDEHTGILKCKGRINDY